MHSHKICPGILDYGYLSIVLRYSCIHIAVLIAVLIHPSMTLRASGEVARLLLRAVRDSGGAHVYVQSLLLPSSSRDLRDLNRNSRSFNPYSNIPCFQVEIQTFWRISEVDGRTDRRSTTVS